MIQKNKNSINKKFIFPSYYINANRKNRALNLFLLRKRVLVNRQINQFPVLQIPESSPSQIAVVTRSGKQPVSNLF